jgi:hypothetical protein
MIARVTGQAGLVILAGIAIAGAIVLTAVGKVVPTDLWTVAYILIGGSAGVAQSPPTAALVTAPTDKPVVTVTTGAGNPGKAV